MPGRLASPAIFQAGSADMKPISLTVHGAIDYLAVVIFAGAPAIIGLSGWPAALSYALAGIHLLMTLLTDFPAGVIKVIPIVLHQWVERIVGPVLVPPSWPSLSPAARASNRGCKRGHARDCERTKRRGKRS